MTLDDATVHVLSAADPEPPRRITNDITDRWLVAYAAAVGDKRFSYFDVERPGGIVAHPVFPACLEWPLVEHGAPGIALSEATLRRGLHVGQEVEFIAPIRSGQRLTTTAELHIAQQRSTATHIATQFHTVDEQGSLLVVTRTHMLYPGVRLSGSAKPAPDRPVGSADGNDLAPIGEFTVDETNAIIYTECARIFNPIHTDIRVAKAAGLKNTVLHGTETLARAVSLITSRLPDSPAIIRSLSCRFTGIVTPGARLEVRAAPLRHRSTHFDVRAADGTTPISNGYLQLTEVR